ncbi:MAG: hypothetical protein AAFV29_16250, partial [Myxococcota bacterium]
MLKQIATRATNDRDIRNGRILSTLGVVLCTAAGIVVGAFFGGQSWLPTEISIALFIGAVVAGMYAAEACFQLYGWFEQRQRDIIAAGVWRALKGGNPPPHPFTLYLRPFASTDHIGTEVHTAIRMRPVASGPITLAMGSDRLEFEAEVERALRPIGPLVALGAPLEHKGAGRILVSDDEWRDAVERLMHYASLIVLLPSSRPGTTWEVKTLLSEGRLGKTIVVDPPDDLGQDTPEYDPSSEWREVRSAFAAHGFELPPDDPQGLLLYFGDQSQPLRKTQISLDGAASVKAFAD